ncbi:MAG: hypothetical protein ACHQZS_10105 [Candidatus Binatales bacterium]
MNSCSGCSFFARSSSTSSVSGIFGSGMHAYLIAAAYLLRIAKLSPAPA